MTGPLSHIRILDMSRILAGPWAAQNLADLGAEVVKLERPGSGDDTRHWGPPYLMAENGTPTAEAAYYLAANRGKKSVAVDIAAPSGQELVRALAKTADVLIENYKVGGLAKYGLGYDDLKADNPGLIYCSITGFGQTGPYAGKPGYDFVIQGMGGLMSVTGEKDGQPGGGPQKVGVAVADLMTGMYATVAILAALAHRDKTGEGQHIDMALLDAQVAMMANQNMNYLISGAPPGRLGNAHPNIVPYQVFACSDGDLIIGIGNGAQFTRLCEILGCPECVSDPRFATNDARVKNREALVTILSEILARESRAHWNRALDEAGIPCGPINNLDEVFDDPQVRHRGLRIDLPHPLSGSVPQVAAPFRFSATPVDYEAAPPTLGQHTDDVLREQLGLAQSEIDGLRQQGVIQ